MIPADVAAMEMRVVRRYEVLNRNEGFVLVDKSGNCSREVASAWPEDNLWRWRLNYEKFTGEPYPTAMSREEALDAMKAKLEAQVV
jgi:hypothetical protein